MVPSCDLHVGGIIISLSNAACNLGVMMESAEAMCHVLMLCKSASFALLKISRIRNFLNQSTTIK